MSAERLPPADIAALIKTYREKGSLSAAQIQKVLDWQAGAVEAQTTAALASDEPSTFREHDIVSFVMPPSPQGKPYFKNGTPFLGPCQATYAEFRELARKHQQAWIGVQELVAGKRGASAFGLKSFIDYVPPAITCRLVKRSQKRAA